MPFDNRFALVKLTGKTLRNLFAANLTRDNGLLSVSGLSVVATCKRGTLDVRILRKNGKVVRDKDVLTIATSDFIASGGDGFIGSAGLEPIAIAIDQGALIRDAMAKELTKRGGELRGTDFFDPKNPRIRFDGKRPLTCE